MITLRSEIQNLNKEYSKNKDAIVAKHKILLHLNLANGGEYEPPFIHIYKLYGSTGSINFQRCNYESIRKGKNPDKDLFNMLFTNNPPVNLFRVHDGHYITFRPEAKDGDGPFLKNNETIKEYDLLGPLLIKFDHLDNLPREYSISWYTSINDKIYQIKIQFHYIDTTSFASKRYANVTYYYQKAQDYKFDEFFKAIKD